MTTRTFRQLGIAYGPAPVSIVAKVNDVIVYQGPVTTLDTVMPQLPDTEYDITNVLFTWNDDVAFSGAKVIEISVSGTSGDLVVAGIDANYTIPAPAINLTTGDIDPDIPSSGANEYLDLDPVAVGITSINGTVRTKAGDELGGQWWWNLVSSDTLVKNLTITHGKE